MAKKSYLDGYKDEEDYFANAPYELLQKHCFRITDFETSLIFHRLLMQYRNPFPLLKSNPAIYEAMGMGGGE